jgi:polar amino acid transport system substrate-binding protein/glutamate/aspartate transport system substrate-binding protein
MKLLAAVVLTSLTLAAGASAGTLDRVREHGAFTIGYREDAPPYSFKTQIGEPAGYAVDLCRVVAAAAKDALKLDKFSVNYQPVTAEGGFDDVKNGRVDILCGPTTATLSRRETVDFSILTFIDGASVLFRKDGPQNFQALAGQKVGVRRGTTTEDELRHTLADLKIDAQIVPVTNHEDGLRQLQQGTLSAYFADRAILSALLAGANAPKGLLLSDQYFSREPYALAVARDDDDFRLLVDRTLSRLYRSGAIAEVFAKNFGNAEPSDLLKALFVVVPLPE